MTVKLNLTVNEETAAEIKKYARRKRTSISKIAQALFEKTIKEDSRRIEGQGFIEKTAGIVKSLAIDDLKEEISKAIAEKHGDKGFS